MSWNILDFFQLFKNVKKKKNSLAGIPYKKVAGQTWPTGHSFPTPVLDTLSS